MKKNVGKADQIIRLLIAVVFVILNLVKTVTGFWGAVLLVLAVILILTSLFSFCPLYLPFGIKTTGKSKKEE